MNDDVAERRKSYDKQKDKLRDYLNTLKTECEHNIRKLKRKNKRVKILRTILLISSIVGQTAVSISAPFLVPVAVIASISGVTAVTTAIMGQFQLRDKQSKLHNEIQKLNFIKNKIRYTEALNGDLTAYNIREIYESLVE